MEYRLYCEEQTDVYTMLVLDLSLGTKTTAIIKFTFTCELILKLHTQRSEPQKRNAETLCRFELMFLTHLFFIYFFHSSARSREILRNI